MARRTSEELRDDLRVERKKNKFPTVKLICCKCGLESRIRTHRPELYTNKVKEEWSCLICVGKRKNEVRNTII